MCLGLQPPFFPFKADINGITYLQIFIVKKQTNKKTWKVCIHSRFCCKKTHTDVLLEQTLPPYLQLLPDFDTSGYVSLSIFSHCL